VNAQFGNEIGLLRTLARNLISKSSTLSLIITEDFLRKEGLARVRRQAHGFIGILRPGHEAFIKLSESILGRFPAMERGAVFTNFETELFDFLAATYLDRDPASISGAEVSALHDHLGTWFTKLVRPRRIFVPCVISPWSAPRFAIGPAVFLFIEEAAQSEFYPRGDPSDILSRDGFDRMLRLMSDERANWLACVEIEGCEQQRAEEIGALAVDLAIVALQLAAPSLGTRTMTRLDGRRGAAEKRTLSEADGYYNAGWTRMEPGLSIGTGTLADILQKSEPLITAVGSCVRSFATGCFYLPDLERAWCDAAYWLHEALTEPPSKFATLAAYSTDLVTWHRLGTIDDIANLEYGSQPDIRILSDYSVLFAEEYNPAKADGSIPESRESGIIGRQASKRNRVICGAVGVGTWGSAHIGRHELPPLLSAIRICFGKGVLLRG
jgi:hypothetical protein